MTEQQKHLQQLFEQQQLVLTEINTLNNQVTTKRELAFKIQGVIEYLEQTGVKLPTAEELAAESAEVVVEEKKDLEKPEESPKNP